MTRITLVVEVEDRSAQPALEKLTRIAENRHGSIVKAEAKPVKVKTQ